MADKDDLQSEAEMMKAMPIGNPVGINKSLWYKFSISDILVISPKLISRSCLIAYPEFINISLVRHADILSIRDFHGRLVPVCLVSHHTVNINHE